MKQFFKYVLATMLGLFLMWSIAGIFSFMMLGAMMAAGDAKPALKSNSVLKISLTGTLSERAQENPLALFTGNRELEGQGLEDMLHAIKVAQAEKDVKGIYLEGGALSADFASLEELRKALVGFKKTGKFVYAYADNYTEGAYYVCSVADSVMLNPSGMLDWHGVASQPIFYKDLLDKLGVKMQVFKVGTYKSAVEPYILTQMSEANREQVQSFVADIWGNIVKHVGESRHLTADTLNAYADRYTALADAGDYVKMKLVDGLVYADQMRDMLRRALGGEKVNFIASSQLAKLYEKRGDDKIAVYIAEGGIVDEAASGFSQNAEIVGQKVVKDLDELANDDDVKAVVLRINSGGGSAYASEQMWRAIQLLKAKKPVVVSMGGLAASGGYYMSCGASYIVAEPTTLTGSIGIFGMVPDMSGLMTEKLGLHFDVVKTNTSADFGAMGRPFNEAEGAAMQAYVDRGYRLFLSRVAAGRGMKPEDVDSIAQGRVWTGQQALGLKLVDKLGTLDDAIAKAAELAKVKDYGLQTYPTPSNFLTQLLEDQQESYMERKLRDVMGVYYEPVSFLRQAQRSGYMQARLPFNPNLR
ncbi:MAG: signal peptide peptidase SppA [Alloprevotella sp.]|nr:signal peptide peptidase SppA [Alloprevotella sp.]